MLVDDRHNEFNPRALLLNMQTGLPVGYAPDYLVDTIHLLRECDSRSVYVLVEHLNGTETAPHMRLLCRLSAPWPDGFEPLSGPDFQPLVD